MTIAEGRGRGRVTLVMHKLVGGDDPSSAMMPAMMHIIVIPRALVKDVFWSFAYVRVKLLQEEHSVLDSEYLGELASDEMSARAIHGSIINEDVDVVWHHVLVDGDDGEQTWTWRRTPDAKS